MAARTAVFFARVADPAQIDDVEFYAQDVGFLRDLGYSVRIVTRTRDLLRTPPADLYFCWWWTWAAFPVMLAQALRRPAVITGTFNHHLFAERSRPQRRAIAHAARHASANIFVSRLECDVVPTLIDVRRATYSPHTVDVDRYAPPASGEGSRDPALLLTSCHLAGGNAERKCVAESIRALALLRAENPALRLTVVGERGDDYPALARLASAVGVADHVHFAGHVSREEKVALMQRCAVYLQPSRFEGFGLAGLEAMACGAPLVTSPVGAVREVGGDAAIYVDGSDPAAIAEATRGLLNDDARRRGYGRAGRDRAVAHFSPHRRRDDLMHVFRSVGAGQ